MFNSLYRMFGASMNEEGGKNLSRIIEADKFVIKLENYLKKAKKWYTHQYNEYIVVKIYTNEKSDFSMFEVNSAWHRVYGRALFDYSYFAPEVKKIEDSITLAMEEMENLEEDTDGGI